MDVSTRCPCCTGLPYGECCGPFIAGKYSPPTAERLMRSRYTAYVLQYSEYLLATWHPSTRPTRLVLDLDAHWSSLEILAITRGGMLDTHGTVEFRATYRRSGARLHQHENSSFVRENKTWFYVDGIIAD